jgi:hypothetical protein
MICGYPILSHISSAAPAPSVARRCAGFQLEQNSDGDDGVSLKLEEAAN